MIVVFRHVPMNLAIALDDKLLIGTHTPELAHVRLVFTLCNRFAIVHCRPSTAAAPSKKKTHRLRNFP